MNNEHRLPLEIGVISIIHMVIGFSAAIDIIVNLLEWGVWSVLKINVIFAFVGLQLLRRKKAGKNGTYILSVVNLFIVLLCVLIYLCSNIGWFSMGSPSLQVGHQYYNYPEWLAWVVLIFVSLLSLWMIYSVRKYDRLGYFSNQPSSSEKPNDYGDRNSQPVEQESNDRGLEAALQSGHYIYISTAILISILFYILPIKQLAAEVLPEQKDYSVVKYVSTKKTRTKYKIYYGERFRGLAYVVFHIQDGNSRSSELVKKEDGIVKLKFSSEETFYLPGDSLLYEIKDGEIRKRDADITTQQFRSFLKSDPKQFDIEALTYFVKQRNRD